MPSARDEDQRPQANNDTPAESSTNEEGSVVESNHPLRSLAENLKRPEVSETEKKVKDAVQQLASLQESVRKLNEIRSRIHQTSVERETETKKKNPPKTGSRNVIPFPVPHRPEEPASAPEQVPAPGIIVPQAPVEAPPPKIEELYSPPGEPIVQTPSPPATMVDELPPRDSDETTNQAKTIEAETAEDVAQDQPVLTDPPARLSVPTVEPEEDERGALSPEVLESNPLATLEERILSSKRSAAVDSEIRALVKQYGEVDIYSNRQAGGKQILFKAVMTGLLLIAALAASYLFMS
jgi:hypothetical protein